MQATNVNIGVCHHRIQQGQKPFFVNWNENGKNKYKFFHCRSSAERLKKQLTNNR